MIVNNKVNPPNDVQADATERRRLTDIYRWWSREWGLVLCAVAPLGGLLSPVWIVARERWWSEYEERWFEQRQIKAG